LIIAISLPDTFLANGAAKRVRRDKPGDDGGNRRAVYSSRRASSGNMIGIPSRMG
jgi:hypothetical protein